MLRIFCLRLLAVSKILIMKAISQTVLLVRNLIKSCLAVSKDTNNESNSQRSDLATLKIYVVSGIKDTNNESNSQPTPLLRSFAARLLAVSKITNNEAIHNETKSIIL